MTSNSDRSSQQQKDQPTPAKGGVCPFVANPMPDCHCAQLTSLQIPQVLERCGGGYEQCELFRRRQDSRPLSDGEIPLQHSIRDKEDP
ncbi:hypothetical protein [Trichloromonas acetexigens]|uniref:Uncharacterized protein n=1 Tax=Trichloromonas acetexigens TaxID=38815 RepID=A0A550J3U4_9BACT|nr:hypothetical protein [Desulfuromonas acetexigens]TRO77884.1 hypothetical protein FL622_16770 [Desulfuromonas acetexigens]